MNKIEKMLELQRNYRSVYLLDFYENKTECRKDLKKYIVKNKPNDLNEINILKDSMVNGAKNNKNLFSLDTINELTEAVYTHDFKEIISLYLIDKDRAYIKSHKLFTEKAFYTAIQRFNKRYINHELYNDILEDIYKSFKKNEKKKKNKYVDIYKNNYYKVNEVTLQAIYDSGLSPFDFAYYNDIDYAKFNTYVKSNTNNDMCFEISKRENTLEGKVLELMQKIANGEIDFYDYYQECRISPGSLRKLVSRNNIYGKEVSNFINQNSHPIIINEGNELNAKLVIDEKEVPLEIKIKAINAIKKIDAPLSAANYKKMIRRLLKENN